MKKLLAFFSGILTLFGLPILVLASILVITPHPDDDIITTAGVVKNAQLRGEPVRIVYMTNGDYNSISAGYLRQGEAVTAQSVLGTFEDNLIFLGYPDGYLETILNNYPSASDRFTSPHGQSTTYGNRGLGRIDYHTYRYGVPGVYNRYNILLDLVDLISNYRPDHIFTVSQFDEHDDHRATFQFVRQSILSVVNSTPDYRPTLHKSIVWWSSWPNPMDATSYFSEIPGLTAETGLVWSHRESLDVPLQMQTTNYTVNLKHAAIAAHESQEGVSGFLGNFIHKDEIFWAESVAGDNGPPVINAGRDQTVPEGASVELDGSDSFDSDGGSLSYQWRQTIGIPVQLTGPTGSRPYFTAPTGIEQNEILSFELVVSDAYVNSVPDYVNGLFRLFSTAKQG